MRLDYESLTPDASRHLFAISAAIRRSALDPILRELTAVLVSQLNGCAHCIAVHWEKGAPGRGIGAAAAAPDDSGGGG